MIIAEHNLFRIRQQLHFITTLQKINVSCKLLITLTVSQLEQSKNDDF